MKPIDKTYTGIPWKKGGRTRLGVDCAGLAALWLREQLWIDLNPPVHDERTDAATALKGRCKQDGFTRGDLIFFRHVRSGKVRHVAVCLGADKYLHICKGLESRIDTGTTLLKRLGYEPFGVVSHENTRAVCEALRDPEVGETSTLILIAVSIALSAASYFLAPKPKMGQFRNQTGRYGFDRLVTEASPQIPLADVLGCVTVAGNSPYTTLQDKALTVSDPKTQRANKVVVFGAAPIDEFECDGSILKINGVQYDNIFWYLSIQGSGAIGIARNPPQNKDECVLGSFEGGAITNRPSFTEYKGTHDVIVPVDIRAHYDRSFPVYGFSGSSYIAFRLINSTKFATFNATVSLKSRFCRTFNSSGFVTTQVTDLPMSGLDSSARHKLPDWDIAEVLSVEVDSTPYTQMGPANQTGNVYHINKLKGYIEFLAPLGSAANISVTYTYYPRAWTRNPASHIVYLLTETVRGRGFDESKIEWSAAVALRDYCDQSVTWSDGSGTFTGPRYTCNYAVDFRKTLQEHLRSCLDACYALLFLSGGKIIMKARKAETSVFDFDESNILRGTFSSELIDRSDRANQVELFYNPIDSLNSETSVKRPDLNDQRARADRVGNNGVIDQVLRFPAISETVQAELVAEQILREEVNVRWAVVFKTNVQGLALQPGDVVTVTHSSQPAWSAKPFRIEDLSQDAQDHLELRCSEYFDGAYI